MKLCEGDALSVMEIVCVADSAIEIVGVRDNAIDSVATVLVTVCMDSVSLADAVASGEND